MVWEVRDDQDNMYMYMFMLCPLLTRIELVLKKFITDIMAIKFDSANVEGIIPFQVAFLAMLSIQVYGPGDAEVLMPQLEHLLEFKLKTL